MAIHFSVQPGAVDEGCAKLGSIDFSAWVCEDSLDEEAKAERQEILGSFQAQTQD